jgi:chromate transport protein ChrA
MSKLSAKIKEEIEALIPPTLFFFVALHLVALVRVLMLKATGLAPATSVSIAVAALILGKAVLIADLLPFINRYPDKPLVYNVVWKTVIYVLISMFIHYLERLVDFWRETGSFVAGNEKLLAEIVWPHFWAIQILLVALILMYCTMREFARALGEDKVRRMFFGPLDRAPVS